MFDRSKPKLGCLSSMTSRWKCSSLFDVRKMMFEFVQCSIKWCSTHHYEMNLSKAQKVQSRSGFSLWKPMYELWIKCKMQHFYYEPWLKKHLSDISQHNGPLHFRTPKFMGGNVCYYVSEMVILHGDGYCHFIFTRFFLWKDLQEEMLPKMFLEEMTYVSFPVETKIGSILFSC